MTLPKLAPLLLLLVFACTRDRESTCKSDSECSPGFCDLNTFTCQGGIVDAGNDAAPDVAADGAQVDGQTGDASGTCSVSADCTSPLKPICAAGTCVSCTQGEPTACTDKSLTTPFCDALTGACVACIKHWDCPAATPLCGSGNICVACNNAVAGMNGCMERDGAKPFCSASGAKVGQCVECTKDIECGATGLPICDIPTSACRRCGGDAECVSKSATEPGICMAHEDGRCASTAETVFVQGVDLQAAINSATTTGKKLVIITADSDAGSFMGPNKLSIIAKGPRPAVVGGVKPGLTFKGGEIYVRGISVTSSAGGVLIDGAGFVLEDVIVEDNRVGTFTATQKWGGIFVNNPIGPKRLTKVTIQNNKLSGLVCSTQITLEQVTAMGNVGEDIAPECN